VIDRAIVMIWSFVTLVLLPVIWILKDILT
jgi:hypothetical protein